MENLNNNENINNSSELYNRNNFDDVFIRSVIVGLLNLLDEKLEYEQIYQDNITETKKVPIRYDFGSSDERFAQDYYTFFGRYCNNGNKIDGKFDEFPRGALRLNSTEINSGNITNRFIKGIYLSNKNGKLISYISYLYSIPMNLHFSCEFWFNDIITAFKIDQSLKEIFYKNKSFNVLYKGIKIGCRAGFPDSGTLEKALTYSFDTERNIKYTIEIGIETYLPVFDKTNQIEASNKIEKFAYDIIDKNIESKLKNIKFDLFNTNFVYPSGCGLYLSWSTKSDVSDMCTLNLQYYDYNTETIKNISNIIYNTGNYIWEIPENFSDYSQPNIIYSDITNIIKKPKVLIVPSINTQEILENSFVIIEKGQFKNNIQKIEFEIEYLDKNNKYYNIKNYQFNILNGSIDSDNPVTINGEKHIYQNKLIPKKIDIILSYSLDNNIFDKIESVYIL